MWILSAFALTSFAVIADDLTQMVQLAHQSNLAALQFGQLQFEVSFGTPENLDSARKGQWAPQFSARGRYLYEKNSVKYECVFDIAQQLAAIQPTATGYQQAVASFRYCTNGSMSLSDPCTLSLKSKKYIPQAIITSDAMWRCEFVHCPLRLGHNGLGGSELLRYLNLGNKSSTAHTTTKIKALGPGRLTDLAGTQCILFEFQNGKIKQQFWVDASRGAIPLRQLMTTMTASPSCAEYIYQDIREVKPGVWFPFSETLITYDSNGIVGSTKRLQVTSADFVRPPDKGDIDSLVYDAPVTCIDNVRKLKLSKRMKWQLSALPSIGDTGVTRLVQTEEPIAHAPKLPVPIPRAPRPRWYLAAALLLGFVIFVLGARRSGLFNRK